MEKMSFKFLHTYILNNYEETDFKLNISKKKKTKNKKSDKIKRPLNERMKEHFILKVHNVQLIL